MQPQTYASIARRKDSEAGIYPWSFSETNPGYLWLIDKQEAVLNQDLSRDTTVASTSASAGSVSTAKTFRSRENAPARTDIIEAAITLYQRGLTRNPSRTIGTFGLHKP